MKTRSKCQFEKDLSGFHKCSSMYDGLSPQCKQCRKETCAKSYRKCNYIDKAKTTENLDNERWKPIKEFEDLYQISDYGRVKSKSRRGGGGLLKASPNMVGYPVVQLRNKGQDIRMTVHRLVALHFIDEVEGKDIVDHIDRNRQNNHYTNLRWVTHTENCNNHAPSVGYICNTLDIVQEKEYRGYRAGIDKKNKRFKVYEDAVQWLEEMRR